MSDFRTALRLLPIALALAASMPAETASAQSVDACIYDLSDADLEAQTNRIITDLRDHRAHARRWRFMWLGVYSALSVGGAILASRVSRRNADGTSDPSGQARYRNLLSTAIGAGLYAARLAFYPMPDVWGVRRIERRPNGTRAERMARLRYAADVYQRAAASQKLMTGPATWASGFAWSLGWGGHIARQYDEALTAAQTFLAGPILGTITILTTPNWANAGYAHFASSVCTGQYVPSAEDDAFDLDAFGDEEAVEDDWADPGAGDDSVQNTAEPRSGPSAMVYPTLGGAGVHVRF